jgi:chitinase
MFSGVDIDWEYPVSGNPLDCCASAQDRQNFTALLQTLKTTLTQQNPGQNLVSFAAPAGAQTLQNLDLGTVAQTVDWINLMTYDFNGAFEPYAGSLTNFNAPLHYDSAGPASQASEVDDAAVQAYLKAGVPASKINLGVPFYGRGYSGVTNANNGLFQAFTAPGAGCPSSAAQPGMYPYWCLEQSYINQNGYKVFRDAAAGNVPYLFNPSSTSPEPGSVMISYDDPASLQAKVAYAKQQGLGGVMIWDLSMDDSSFSLLNTVTTALIGFGAPRGTGKPTKLGEAVCSKVGGVPVYAHGVGCGVAKGVYRTYVRAGRVTGWRCSPAGQICVKHVRKKTKWVSWFSRTLARPEPMR